ncbi:uncharacterized protein B0P05DRAFT_583984 [Gilbertella persicaria]|uniref:uncharacterized protein n=1 Tax=Gilbertella persicaria TaxID=101096 RepID=UPI00221EEAF7|nr:uncharacterized protein B0P05DRAFT_583984 [Gilbertella persicaria]KAI8091475.1 hypothetical protein B0P05DRAFT_583984 [Gilbertella persicaria]
MFTTPTQRLLSHLLPTAHSSPSCCLCGDVEDIYHLFFRCPVKFIYWDHLIREYLWPGTTIDHIYEALNCLNFRKIQVLTSCPISSPMLLIIAISEVWKAHWLHVFHNVPFSPLAVFRSCRLAIQRCHEEDTFVDE